MNLVSAFIFSIVFTASADKAPRRLQTYKQTSEYIGLMLVRVNLEREAQRLPPLCINTELQQAAQRHSNDQAMHNFMGHKGSSGSTLSERVTDIGYDWDSVAENVAMGQVNVDEVMDGWMNSEGHRNNILGDYTMLGAAYAFTSNGQTHHFWTQNFGRSDTEKCDDGSVSSNFGTSSNSSIEQTETFFASNDKVMSAPALRNSPINSASSTIFPTSFVHVMLIVFLHWCR
ncbi:RxLR-like protein [Plasmopara halstedii]|uniref:RxLR-like protein n=1 Tax=Plasmopara halstedii TaxID=4781 RepID=A0A0P1A9L9_PLAHL|nr:RxLR-like protein [Plasmopara halstedii]CEG37305.1 RxLR-like protein [Plasmopara halstedii]|eukprot:XP_024573674.1 RxLR-like protein [Plasmopara halstedii]